jgi:Domain of unknown function (DUF4440)
MNCRTNGSIVDPRRAAFAAVALALQCILVSPRAIADPLGSCAPPRQVERDLVALMERIFDALQRDDLTTFQAQLTPNYYIFSGGQRYTAKTFLDAVRQAHAQGLRFTWSVVAPEVHLRCDRAWMTYINRGSITAGAQAKPTEWLESGEYEFRHGAWRARFVHSTQKADDH